MTGLFILKPALHPVNRFIAARKAIMPLGPASDQSLPEAMP
jgi:hypothetical protein